MFVYEVKGNHFLAIFFRSLLVGLGIGCFYLAYFLSSALASPILLLLVLLGLDMILLSIFIRTRELKIDYEKFFIERHGYFKILNECQEYKYSDIESIEYVEGYFRTETFFFKNFFMWELDRMDLIRKDGSKEEIVRIGNREAFKKAIEIIKGNIEKWR